MVGEEGILPFEQVQFRRQKHIFGEVRVVLEDGAMVTDYRKDGGA